ncbi:type II toxin-antitoxin system VapB family antitoxin [Nonomuraea sp. NBC_00507]|uniref:type II toxin-antitoxin system VapB family antitoxin n=1 Tax=Nonomuraea sp. NBC_00507 TaxID=2976002 RepID=UPI002E19BD5D
MSVTQIDIDDDVLKEAMRMMGTTTKKETVNLVLREYVARVRRIEALEKLAARAQHPRCGAKVMTEVEQRDIRRF